MGEKERKKVREREILKAMIAQQETFHIVPPDPLIDEEATYYIFQMVSLLLLCQFRSNNRVFCEIKIGGPRTTV